MEPGVGASNLCEALIEVPAMPLKATAILSPDGEERSSFAMDGKRRPVA